MTTQVTSNHIDQNNALYNVSFVHNNETHYGVVEHLYDTGGAHHDDVVQGIAWVGDAILPKNYRIPLAHLKTVGWDEVDAYVAAAASEAEARAKALPPGVHVGAMFSIGVADGGAVYMVTKVNKRTCSVEWRGFWNGDRYIDHHFGWGRERVPLDDIAWRIGR